MNPLILTTFNIVDEPKNATRGKYFDEYPAVFVRSNTHAQGRWKLLYYIRLEFNIAGYSPLLLYIIVPFPVVQLKEMYCI